MKAKEIKKTKGQEVSQSFLKRYWMQSLLFLICFVFYGNTINNGFNLDDDFVTNNNLLVKDGLKALPEIFNTPYATEGKFVYEYRPLVKATYALEYQFAGTNPTISHFINILIYSVCVLLIFRFLKHHYFKHGIWLAFIVSLLFTIHPVHTEVVASLKNRDGLLSLLFFILTLHYSLNFIKSGKVISLFVSIIAFLAGLLSKIDIVSVLAIIPLAAYFFAEKPWKKTVIVTALLLVTGMFFMYLRTSILEEQNRTFAVYENPLFGHQDFVMTFNAMASSLWFYVKMSFIPYPLLFYYGYNEIPVDTTISFFSVFIFTAILVVLFFLVKAIYKKEEWAFGVAWFLISISLFLNLLPVVGIVAERFLLLPSIGIVMFIGFLLRKLTMGIQNGKSSPSLKTAGILGVLTFITFIQVHARNKDWKSLHTLMSHDIAYLGNSAKAHDLYALSCSQEALTVSDIAQRNTLVKESIRAYKRATEIYPQYTSAYNNIGGVYVNMLNQYEEALPYFKKALELDSNYYQAQANLGFCYQKSGNIELAQKIYRDVIKKDSSKFLNAYFNLGEILFSSGKFDEAMHIQQMAARSFPKADLPWVTMGNYKLMRGDTIGAVGMWERAIEVYPQNEKLLKSLFLYFNSKQNSQKTEFYRMLMEKHF